MNVGQIINGHINEFFNKEQELYNKRIEICKTCPLYKKDNILGYICNPNLYVNPITKETSDEYKPGFYNGCGCRLSAAARTKDKRCPLGFWER